MGALRAAWRLLRALMHLVRGIVIIKTRFASLDDAARQAHIGRWSQELLALVGMRWKLVGELPADRGRLLVVANHISWLDIAAIHAAVPEARFVSKADVLAWPVVGSLIAGAGTLFIERERKRDAIRVVHRMVDALNAEQTVAVFPEGTVSEGHGLLPFHANLLQAAVSSRARVLPLVLRFSDEHHAVSRAVMYVDNVNLLQSAWRVMSAKAITVTVMALPCIDPERELGEGFDRRALSELARERMQSTIDSLRG